METKNSDWAKRDIGALWKREGQNQKYLSGYVKVDELGLERELKIVVFSNKNKNNNEKAPDYRIYVSKPLDKNEASAKPSAQAEKKTKQAVVSQKNKTNDLEEENLL